MAAPKDAEYAIFARAKDEANAKASAANSADRGVWFLKTPPSGATGYTPFDFGGIATGDGVVVGIMDDGLDIFHPAFFHLSGTPANPKFETRIDAIWAPYDNPKSTDTAARKRTRDAYRKFGAFGNPYGTMYFRDEINALLNEYYLHKGKRRICRKVRKNFPFAHGQHGTQCGLLATGHGVTSNAKHPIGIAPDAAIVAVQVLQDAGGRKRLRWDSTDEVKEDHALREAMKFCTYVAENRGKANEKPGATRKARPVVMSQSYGSSIGAPYPIRENQTPYDVVFGNRKNAAIVGAAGNEGNVGNQVFLGTAGSGTTNHQQAVEISLTDNRPHHRKSKKVTEKGAAPLTSSTAIYVKIDDSADASNISFGVLLPVSRAQIGSNPMTLAPTASDLTFEAVNFDVRNGLITSTGRVIATPRTAVSNTPISFGGYTSMQVILRTKVLTTADSNGSLLEVRLDVRPNPASGKAPVPKAFSPAIPMYLVIDAPPGKAVVGNSDCLTYGTTPELGGFFTGNVHNVTWTAPHTQAIDLQPWSGSVSMNLQVFRVCDEEAVNLRMVAGASKLGDRTTVADFSHRGPFFGFVDNDTPTPKPTVSAPGADVQVSKATGRYGWDRKGRGITAPKTEPGDGTSFAAPLLAGTTALMLEVLSKAGREMTPKQIEAHIRAKADKTGRESSLLDHVNLNPYDAAHGGGMLDAFAVVTKL